MQCSPHARRDESTDLDSPTSQHLGREISCVHTKAFLCLSVARMQAARLSPISAAAAYSKNELKSVLTDMGFLRESSCQIGMLGKPI